MPIVDLLIAMDCGLCKLICRVIKINKEQRQKNKALKQKVKIQQENKRKGKVVAKELEKLYKQHADISRTIEAREKHHRELTGRYSPAIVKIISDRLENPSHNR